MDKLYVGKDPSRYEIQDNYEARSTIFRSGFNIEGEEVVGPSNRISDLILNLMSNFVPVNKI